MPDLSDFGEFHEVFDISFALGQDQPPTSLVIKKELLRKINYQMCPQEVCILQYYPYTYIFFFGFNLGLFFFKLGLGFDISRNAGSTGTNPGINFGTI